MKVSNIWKAWLSTLIGVLIPVLTAVGTSAATGKVNWEIVTAVGVPAFILAVTDILKELQKSLATPEEKV